MCCNNINPDELQKLFSDFLKKELSEKKKEYPQLILKTDGTYEIEIEDGVEVKFDSAKSIEVFTKNKNFTIKGRY